MKNPQAHLALIGCNAIWAINYPLYHLVMPKYITPIALLTLSLVGAAIFSWVPRLWQRGERVERQHIFYMVCAAILSGILRKGLVIFGVNYTSPIDASIIASLVPVTALIISVMMKIDRITPWRVVGLLLGMGGAIAVILSGGSSSGRSSGLDGNLMMLAYTLAAGFYMVWLQPIFRRYEAMTIMRWVYTISAFMLLPLGYESITHIDFGTMPHNDLMIVIFMILVPTFAPNLLLNYALKRVRPTISSIYSYLQPIIAISVTVWLGLDKLRWSTLVFGLFIVSGVYIVIRSYASPHRAKL